MLLFDVVQRAPGQNVHYTYILAESHAHAVVLLKKWHAWYAETLKVLGAEAQGELPTLEQLCMIQTDLFTEDGATGFTADLRNRVAAHAARKASKG